MSWESYERAAERGPMNLFWKVLFPILLIICVLGIAGFFLNPFRQAGRIINKTIDADNVLYNYEWFKQRYQDIQALDAKIIQAAAVVDGFKLDAGPRADWQFQDREEYGRLNAVVLGLRQQRSDMAAEYNARSQMANRAIFKTGELPETIPISER